MLSGLILFTQCCVLSAGQAPPSLDALCQAHPQRIQRLFAALDLDRAGLADVKSAVAGQDWPEACEALLEYYRVSGTAAWLRKSAPKPGTGRDASADAILEGRFTECAITANVPRRADGGVDWSYNGPDGDREWGWGLNRQHWGSTLLGAYHNTGNPIYVKHFDVLIRDWILANPSPNKKTSAPQWRGLETFMRIIGCWSAGFYGLQDVDAFSPATRILMLSSIPDHAHYARHFHAGGGNWITMEMRGLAMAAMCWPEFKDATTWYDYAMERMLPEMTEQVYPDGVQKELTSHYHRVALACFDGFADLAKRAGRAIPPEYQKGIEGMFDYLAYAMRPSGYGPLNNDSNLDYTRAGVLSQVERFKRPDWAYIASNGAEGTKPEGLPSVVFPWAGQVIMRSGWDANAHWSYFEAGPFGTGHQHHDSLHLSVTANGRDILVDGGRYTYKGGPFRSYFKGSASHNLVLIDGKGQGSRPKEAKAPLGDAAAITEGYDYARGVFDAGFADVQGKVSHMRAVAYLRGAYWIVVDRITTDRPRTVSPLWHFHPDCTVAVEGNAVTSTDADKGNVRITPVSGLDWKVDLVKGQGEPDIQGWWSREYNHKTPSSCAVYSASIEDSAVFAWVITPGVGPVAPLAEASLLSTSEEGVCLRIQRAGEAAETVFVPFQSTEVTRQP